MKPTKSIKTKISLSENGNASISFATEAKGSHDQQAYVIIARLQMPKLLKMVQSLEMIGLDISQEGPPIKEIDDAYTNLRLAIQRIRSGKI